MSPDEYLKHLQRKLAKHYLDFSTDSVRAYLEENRPDLVHWRPGLTDEEIDQQVDRVVNEVRRNYGPLDSVLAAIKTKLVRTCDPCGREEIAAVPVGSMFTEDPNGWVIRSPNGAPVVGVHTGVMHLCYWTSNAIAVVHEIDGQGSRRRNLTTEEMRTISRRLLNSCITLITGGQVVPQDVHNPLNFAQLHMGCYIMDSMEMFIVGHEFGHISLGHLDESPLCSSDGIQYYLTSCQEEEYKADKWSLDRMLWIKANEAAIPKEEWWLVNGPSLALSALLALEKAEDVLVRITPRFLKDAPKQVLTMSNSTHPPTLRRRTNLLEDMARQLGAEDPDYQEAKDLAAFLDTIVDIFDEVSEDMVF